MALFPTEIPVGYATRLTPDAGKRIEKAEDGTVVVLNYFTNTVYDGVIEIPWCTEANKVLIDAFYATNKNFVWTFYHPGDAITYSLFFANEPYFERLETAGDVRWKVSMPVVGNR